MMSGIGLLILLITGQSIQRYRLESLSCGLVLVLVSFIVGGLVMERSTSTTVGYPETTGLKIGRKSLSLSFI